LTWKTKEHGFNINMFWNHQGIMDYYIPHDQTWECPIYVTMGKLERCCHGLLSAPFFHQWIYCNPSHVLWRKSTIVL
jgi:hypothetical protein